MDPIAAILIIPGVLLAFNLIRWNIRKETDRASNLYAEPRPTQTEPPEPPEVWLRKPFPKLLPWQQKMVKKWEKEYTSRFDKRIARLKKEGLFRMAFARGPETDLGRIGEAMLNFLAAQEVLAELPDNPYAPAMFEDLRCHYISTHEKVNSERVRKGLEPIG